MRNRADVSARPVCFGCYYAPVLPRKRLRMSLTMANETLTPSITNIKIPTLVRCPATWPSAGTHTNVSKPLKNSPARSAINPKPLLIALIISLPISFSFLGKFLPFFMLLTAYFGNTFIYIIIYYKCKNLIIFIDFIKKCCTFCFFMLVYNKERMYYMYIEIKRRKSVCDNEFYYAIYVDFKLWCCVSSFEMVEKNIGDRFNLPVFESDVGECIYVGQRR